MFDPKNPVDLVVQWRHATELEKKMFAHAEHLEFEEAAQVRDEISRLKEHVLKA